MEWITAWRYDTLDRRVFLRVSVVLMISAVLNSLLKGVFQVPRPTSPCVWWWKPDGPFRESKRRWTWFVAAFLAVGIAASRVYLGVHSPRDVIVGILLGVGLFLGLWWLADLTPGVWSQLPWRHKAALVVVPVVLLLVVLPNSGDGDETVAKAGGALIGLALGADLERRRLRSDLGRHGSLRDDRVLPVGGCALDLRASGLVPYRGRTGAVVPMGAIDGPAEETRCNSCF